MDNQQQNEYGLQTRSRSRSMTPQMFTHNVIENENTEVPYELRSRSRDRSMTPGEVSSSRRSAPPKPLSNSTVKARKNMESIAEQLDETLTNISDVQPKKTAKSSVVKSIKKSERRSERQKAKRLSLANGQSEIKDDSSDTKSETKESKSGSLTPKRMMTSDYSSEDGDREDMPSRPGSAYEFYKQQGDYWNKFPKTDYTYSPTSTCRYEVAPGVMAIPNMSRRSLHSTETSFYGSQTPNSQSSKESLNEDNNTLKLDDYKRDFANMVPQVLPHIRGSGAEGSSVVYKRTHVEQYSTRRELIYDSINENQINERYESWANPLHKTSSAISYGSTAIVDSDTEFDEALSMNNHKHSFKRYQTSNSFTKVVSEWFYTIFHFLTFNRFKKQEFSTSHYYRRYEETKWSRLRRRIDTVMQYMYLLLVNVLLLDSWLLSRASNIRERVQGRRTKILWLVFLPLVLTIGSWLLPFIFSTIPLSSKSVSQSTQTPIVQNFQESIESNQELRNIIDLLINRVQHLEKTRTEQSEQLSSVTQVLEELKRNSSDLWKNYDEKLLNLEQVIDNQNDDVKTYKSEELDIIRLELQTLKQMYIELKNCCYKSSNVISDEEMQKQADKIFAGYFGDNFSKHDIIKIFQIMNSKIQQDEFSKTSEATADPSIGTNLGINEIRKIIQGVLKIYDADKTGRVDYALESAGGQIISTRCTQLYNIHTRAYKILGMTLFYESNNPRTVIQGNTLQPGMCWAFQDFPGYLLVKLRYPIYVTGFTVEHAPKSNLPNGEMKSAPKMFNVWGLTEENDTNPVMLGEYEFLDSEESLQYFPIQNTSITSPYEYVEMRIHSNHGQLEYTCLYRFRVHGNLA